MVLLRRFDLDNDDDGGEADEEGDDESMRRMLVPLMEKLAPLIAKDPYADDDAAELWLSKASKLPSKLLLKLVGSSLLPSPG
jgi:hypothetical protein